MPGILCVFMLSKVAESRSAGHGVDTPFDQLPGRLHTVVWSL